MLSSKKNITSRQSSPFILHQSNNLFKQSLTSKFSQQSSTINSFYSRSIKKQLLSKYQVAKVGQRKNNEQESIQKSLTSEEITKNMYAKIDELNVSCLYSDFIHANHNKDFMQSLALETICNKLLYEKKEKGKILEINEELSKNAKCLEIQLNTLKFAYEALKIDHSNQKKKLKTMILKREKYPFDESSERQKIKKPKGQGGVNQKIRKQKTEEASVVGNQTEIESNEFLEVEQAQESQKLFREEECLDDLNNKYTIKVVAGSKHESNQESFRSEKEAGDGELHLKYKGLMERQQIIHLLAHTQLNSSVHPDIQEFKLRIFTLIGGPTILKEEIQKEIRKAENAHQLTICKINQDHSSLSRQHDLAIQTQTTQIKDIQDQLQQKNQEQFKLTQKVNQLQEHLEKAQNKSGQMEKLLAEKEKELTRLQILLSRIEEANEFYLRREEQKQQEGLILKKFTENLQINDEKIQSFIKEEFSNQIQSQDVTSYQEKISYLTYLYRKKEEVYDQFVEQSRAQLREYQYVLMLIERKAAQAEHFQIRLLQCQGKEAIYNLVQSYFGLKTDDH